MPSEQNITEENSPPEKKANPGQNPNLPRQDQPFIEKQNAGAEVINKNILPEKQAGSDKIITGLENVNDTESNTENIAVNAPQPVKPETENMEIHTHHLDKGEHHGWKHYFFEFFMLFLAVTLGFFVENIRENLVERQREKEFMISLVEDLDQDVSTLNHQVRGESSKIMQMDSLIYFLPDKGRSENNARLYYFGRTASRHDIFNYNNRTIDQMRNSGGFRLVQSQKVASLIMDYYRKITLLEQLESIEKNEEMEYRKLAVKVFDPVVFNSMTTERDSVIPPVGNPSLRTRDPNTIADLMGWVQYMKSSIAGLNESKKNLAGLAENLASAVKNEYHFK